MLALEAGYFIVKNLPNTAPIRPTADSRCDPFPSLQGHLSTTGLVKY